MTAPPLLASSFAPRLIEWQRRAGRHGLPWQGTRDPYRVWLSEIMLQQTQVSTVLGYYPRFLERFPDVASLAAAPADDVMALWSGLGYYSRARHLHRCAQVVVSQHGGRFPRTASELQTLPGIGASTAAAIAAFCFNERVSILDGNVRRVLSRLLAFDGDVATVAAQRRLWVHAQALLPAEPAGDDMAAYTQGLMDLGATLCTRSKPRCPDCPVGDLCAARSAGDPARFPVKSRKLVRRFERWWVLLLTRGGSVWLQRRPERGIWAGLYAPPVFDTEVALRTAVGEGMDRFVAWEPVSHSLTHRELQLLPLQRAADDADTGLPGQWLPLDEALGLGLPTPVRALLQTLRNQALPQ
jgi:A/G-specific adenine glycosylase